MTSAYETFSDLMRQIVEENPNATRAELIELFCARTSSADPDLLDEAVLYAHRKQGHWSDWRPSKGEH